MKKTTSDLTALKISNLGKIARDLDALVASANKHDTLDAKVEAMTDAATTLRGSLVASDQTSKALVAALENINTAILTGTIVAALKTINDTLLAGQEKTDATSAAILSSLDEVKTILRNAIWY